MTAMSAATSPRQLSGEYGISIGELKYTTVPDIISAVCNALKNRKDTSEHTVLATEDISHVFDGVLNGFDNWKLIMPRDETMDQLRAHDLVQNPELEMPHVHGDNDGEKPWDPTQSELLMPDSIDAEPEFRFYDKDGKIIGTTKLFYDDWARVTGDMTHLLIDEVV